MSTLVEYPMDTIAQRMRLPLGQRLLRVSVDADPQMIWFYIEGGEEFPAPYAGAPWWSVESPIVGRGPDWPMPLSEPSGVRQLAKTWAYAHQVFPDTPIERVFVREGADQLLCFVFAGDPPESEVVLDADVTASS